jgi:hypothetical protein
VSDHLPGAITPYVPYRTPVPVPTLTGTDVCIKIDEGWIPYIVGVAKALTVNSTWKSSDLATVQAAVKAANDLLDALIGAACNMTISFAPSTDDGDQGDGKIHVTITPDANNPGEFDVSVKHPAYPTTLTGLVAKVPTGTNANVIAGSGTPGIIIEESGATGIEISSEHDQIAYWAAQPGSTAPTQPLYHGVRDKSGGAAFADFQLTDAGVVVPAINGYAEISARRYDALPTADATHRGAIVLLTHSDGTPDTPYYCAFSTVLGWTWVVYTGPAGPPGASGTTPLFRVQSGYIQVSYDNGASYTNFLALSAITGPQGPQGPVADFNTPALLTDAPARIDIAGNGTTATPYHLSFHLPPIAPITITPPTGQTICDVSEAISGYVLSLWNTYITTANNGSNLNQGVLLAQLLAAIPLIDIPALIFNDLTTINTNTSAITPTLSYSNGLMVKNCLWCAMQGTSGYFDATMQTDWQENVVTYLGPTAGVLAETFADFIQSLDWPTLNIIGAAAAAGSGGSCSGYTCPPTFQQNFNGVHLYDFTSQDWTQWTSRAAGYYGPHSGASYHSSLGWRADIQSGFNVYGTIEMSIPNGVDLAGTRVVGGVTKKFQAYVQMYTQGAISYAFLDVNRALIQGSGQINANTGWIDISGIALAQAVKYVQIGVWNYDTDATHNYYIQKVQLVVNSGATDNLVGGTPG